MTKCGIALALALVANACAAPMEPQEVTGSKAALFGMGYVYPGTFTAETAVLDCADIVDPDQACHFYFYDDHPGMNLIHP